MADRPTDVPWPEEWPRKSSRGVLGAVAGLPLGAMTIGGGVAAMGERPLVALFLFACGWLLAMCTVLLPVAQPGGPGRSREHVRAYAAGPMRGVHVPASRPVRWSRRALVGPLALAVPLSLLVLWAMRNALSTAAVTIWILAVLGVTAWMVRAFVRALRRRYPEGILLTEDGFAVQHPIRTRFVPWSQVLGFTARFEAQGSQWLVLILEGNDLDHGEETQTGGRTKMRDRQIVANTLGVDPALVPAALSFYLDNPPNREELSSDVGVRRIRTADFSLSPAERESSERLRMEEFAATLPEEHAALLRESPQAETAAPIGSEAAQPDVPNPPHPAPSWDGNGRPPAWRGWSPRVLWGYWAFQVVGLLVGAVAVFGFAMGATSLGAMVGVGAGMPVALPASAILLIPVGTTVLVLIRSERIRCADVSTLGDVTTIRPARRLRVLAWLAIVVLAAGMIGPIALLFDFRSTGGPVAAAAFGWAAGCGFMAWPALSGLRKVLGAVRADDQLQVRTRDLTWRAQGYEWRVGASDVVDVIPEVGGHGQDPCIRVAVSGAGTDVVIPWRFLTAGPMLVLRTLRGQDRMSPGPSGGTA